MIVYTMLDLTSYSSSVTVNFRHEKGQQTTRRSAIKTAEDQCQYVTGHCQYVDVSTSCSDQQSATTTTDGEAGARHDSESGRHGQWR